MAFARQDIYLIAQQGPFCKYQYTANVAIMTFLSYKDWLNEEIALRKGAKVSEKEKILMAKLEADFGYKDFKIESGLTMYVLVGKEEYREDVLDKISKAYGLKIIDKPSMSTLGMIDMTGFFIDSIEVDGKTYTNVHFTQLLLGAKDKDKQGKKSSGITNELNFLEALQNAIGHSATSSRNIIFKGKNGQEYICKDVISVEHSGKDTANRAKADIKLISKGNNVWNLSLKKNNAEYWESADTLLGPTAKKHLDAIRNNKTKNIKFSAIEKGSSMIWHISPSISWDLDDKLKKDVVFGSDVGASGCVIHHTFRKGGYPYYIKDNDAIFEVDGVYVTLKDIPKKETPVAHVRNDSSRKSTALGSFEDGGYPGLRVTATMQKHLSKNTLKIR